MNNSSDVLTKAIYQLLKPLVRLLLRNGIAFSALSELLKKLYIEVAESDFAIAGKKQSVSRISTLTGLTRKEVSRTKSLEKIDLSEMTQQYNRAARVISGWINDPLFQNKAGEPEELFLDKGDLSFKELVKIYSGDVPSGAIIDELLRVGAIKQSADNKIKLIKKAYIPTKSVDEKIRILGTDVRDLVSTIDHNIFVDPQEPYFQRKVSYNSIGEEALPFLRKKLDNRSQACLEELNQLLANYDSDTNPKITKKGTRRIGIGIYYFEDKNNED
ncbi:MAG: DUF6502 family protein [Gammaproteobacteria bacterium]